MCNCYNIFFIIFTYCTNQGFLNNAADIVERLAQCLFSMVFDFQWIKKCFFSNSTFTGSNLFPSSGYVYRVVYLCIVCCIFMYHVLYIYVSCVVYLCIVCCIFVYHVLYIYVSCHSILSYHISILSISLYFTFNQKLII